MTQGGVTQAPEGEVSSCTRKPKTEDVRKLRDQWGRQGEPDKELLSHGYCEEG